MKRSIATLAAVFSSYPHVQVDVDPDGRVRVVGVRDGTVDEIRETGTPMTTQQRKLLLMSARKLGMTDEERFGLAEVVLRRDVTTWSDFTQTEAGRMIDTLDGFEKVSHLLLSRPSRKPVSAPESPSRS